MTRLAWTKQSRPVGDVWVHESRQFWVVFYPATEARAAHWNGYKANHAPRLDQAPWSIDNKRLSVGFRTIDEAMDACEKDHFDKNQLSLGI